MDMESNFLVVLMIFITRDSFIMGNNLEKELNFILIIKSYIKGILKMAIEMVSELYII